MFKIIALAALFHVLAFGSGQVPNMNTFTATPAFHVHTHINSVTPYGFSPAKIKSAYNLPTTGGTGTIAIIDAYDDPYIQNDLGVFDKQYLLATCTTSNSCFSEHKMTNRIAVSSGWALETSLDVEWAHAIAPNAHILLVEARSASGNDLLSAIDYARRQPGVTAISMSWGGSEFPGDSAYDSYFTSLNGKAITFFAASGDSGNGVEWPAVSANVTGVGGTTLQYQNNTLSGEIAWSGSSGGISAYTPEPAYQQSIGIQDGGMRAVPDVSFDADPASGASVYDSIAYSGQSGWWQVGGTSLGSPSWAAIQALGTGSNTLYYADYLSNPTDFRDIVSGSNGACGVVCNAAAGYDTLTGLGSPLTVSF